MKELLHEVGSDIGKLLAKMHGESRDIQDIHEQGDGPQGYSGSRIRYFDVTNRDARGVLHTDRVVSKTAVLFERRVLGLLSSRNCAVPHVVLPDSLAEERLPVFMPFLEARPPFDAGHPESPITLSVAEGLAGIHAANRTVKPEWMARTSDDFRGYLWLNAWRERWEENLRDPEFAAEFGSYTPRLDAAMDGFLGTLKALAAEGSSLTVLNVDLLPDHIRLWREKARFIDWEQSSFGPLYLDLPNYFTVETALIYRDALDRLGYSIPVLEFMERFHEVGRYMGLRYLGFSLWQWAQGGEDRRKGRWFLYYTFGLALNGR